MTSEQQSKPDSRMVTLPPPVILKPWFVVAGALLVYLVTLNHWVSLRSLPVMAQVTGWDWQPYPVIWRQEFMAPLFIVLTAPIRLLPAGWEPLALNIFTAICASLTLGLLARSVRLWPQDRTRDQMQREYSSDGILTLRSTILPALFAVLMLGAQLTFWENSIVATGEMINVLALAFIVNCLLEYRVSKNVNWMLGSAFVYGLAATNDWAFVGFFPWYLVVVLAIRGFAGFFNVKFLVRMFGCGLAGLPLCLLLPAAAAIHNHMDFWSVLQLELGSESYGLRSFPRFMLIVVAVPTIVPLFFATIKWPRLAGEISAVGDTITRYLLNLVHVAMLALLLATFFEFKYSPSIRMREMGLPFLTFYYLAALGIGYFTGYMLLVFGKPRIKIWESPSIIRGLLYPVLYGLAWVAAVAAPVVLVVQTFPKIHAADGEALKVYADHLVDCLPSRPSVVLSDDAARLYLVQADFERRKLRNEHFLIDTADFQHRDYIKYLAGRYSGLKSVMTTNIAGLPPTLASANLINFMYQITANFPVYYLHPSFGYYFEALYLRPAGLAFEMKPYSTNSLRPPLVTASEVKTNEEFWGRLENGFLKDFAERTKLDPDSEAVATDCAVALDYWGTELQKAKYLKEAHNQFAEAVRLNTNNFIASINLQYNEQLQKGLARPIEAVEPFTKALSYYHNLDTLLRRNGPPDEPALDVELGEVFAEKGNMHQASLLFERCLELLPGNPEAMLNLAKTEVYRRNPEPDQALELLAKVKASGKVSPWQIMWCEAAAYTAKNDTARAEKILEDAVAADPKDLSRIVVLTEFYRANAVELFRAGKPEESARNFSNAVSSIDRELQLIAASGREDGSSFIFEALVKKAEIQMQLRAYTNALATLNQALDVQPRNYNALVDRARVEIEIKQLEPARADFEEVGKILPKAPYIKEFGLASVAEAENNKAEAINHLKRALKTVPEEGPDYRAATNRLARLESK